MKDEVAQALRDLKSSKATRKGGIVAEMVKYRGNNVIDNKT